MQLQNQLEVKHAPLEVMYVTQALTTRMSYFAMKMFREPELRLKTVKAKI